MQNKMAERYRLQYLLLVKEFLDEVERGTEWVAIRPILQEMKKINHCLECIDDTPSHTRDAHQAPVLLRA
jgi:hypothetical protein